MTLVREPFTVDPEAEIVRLVRERRRGAEIAGAPYWTDAAFIAAAGIPTVLFGPGGDGAHADVEWVSLSDTEAVFETLVEVARAAVFLNPAYDPAAVPAAVARRARVPPRARRVRADADARCCRRRSASRTSRTGSACPRSRSSARRGRPSARCARTPDVHTLVAASAGNHGRAVARVAAMRGLRARVFLPARSLPARREAIAGEGAEVVIVDGTYEDAVARAAAEARAAGLPRARRRRRVRPGASG